MLRKHYLGDGEIGQACLAGINNTQHLFRTLPPLAGQAPVRRHAPATRRRPQPFDHGQPVRRVVIEQHHGGERSGEAGIRDAGVEMLSIQHDVKIGIALRGGRVPLKPVSREMKPFERCGTWLEQDRTRVGFGGPEDRLGDRGQPRLCREIATPIAR